MKGTGGSEFGSRLQNASHDHSRDQIEIVAGMLIDEWAELQSVQGAEDGGDVAMGARADDVEGLGQGSADRSGAL